MEKTVLVLDANKNQRIELCKLLKEGSYSAILLQSIQRLEKYIQAIRCLAVFWDIDPVPMDNRTIRELTIKFPEVYFFYLSSHPFHPELQDAICYHIYACINRPIDLDELSPLRSIDDNELNPDRSVNP